MADQRLGRFVDLYELRMAQSYLEHGVTGEAVFDLHVRTLPDTRGFLVASGTQRLAERLDRFTFDEEDIEHLASLGLSDDLLAYLERFSFDDAEIRAVPEGTPVFGYEPILQIRAPLPVAQLVETLVLNTVHVETLLATKAARCYEAVRAPVDADDGPAVVDFGARRAHGLDAARSAARAAYVGGLAGTSLVEAADAFGIPCFGTMAHAYVEAFANEREALSSFARSFPDGTTLLVDTYDTVEGVRTVVDVAAELREEGVEIGGVRIDSGDLGALAREARRILDEGGLGSVEVFVSGGLDELAIASLLEGGAPIDGFGVGTSLVVSSDAPSLDICYKLAAYEGEPVLKTSPGKPTLPGAKQCYRRTGDDGRYAGDTIALVDEPDVDGMPLLEPLEPLAPVEAAQAARTRFLDTVHRLPDEVRALEDPAPYPVDESSGIGRAIEAARERAGAVGPAPSR